MGSVLSVEDVLPLLYLKSVRCQDNHRCRHNSETVVIFPDLILSDFNETDWHRTDREMKVKARDRPSNHRDCKLSFVCLSEVSGIRSWWQMFQDIALFFSGIDCDHLICGNEQRNIRPKHLQKAFA